MNKKILISLITLLLYFVIPIWGQNDSEDLKLPFSKTEVEDIQQIVGGDLLLNEDANLSDILTKIEKYDVIHLATHTIVDEQAPLSSKFLLYKNRELFLSKIYSLNLNAKMAVLSSCNTGRGKLERGEGIISFARAFKFAGCSSIIMSLWEIDDISTANIMRNFYSELKNGKPKDVALREAKLEYLSESNSKTASPVFWAATVPIGTLEALNFEVKNSFAIWGYILLALILILATAYLLKHKSV